MELFPLDVFPVGSLANSVTTTVWVGVMVIGFFNLRFGWVLSGLVVPGYLVPLMILRPWGAFAILVEAILTYALVWLFSERAGRIGGWSSFFGRDRFFALLLGSVIVRVLADGWGWPLLLQGLASLGTPLPLPQLNSGLQSFGLVIIALMANQFWKPGLLRGLWQLFLGLGITYLLVRYVLMEGTNFAISNIAYMYEDVAMSIAAGPKAYIVLLTTAYVASRMNLFYGWDFSGILIPSLLALQWYQPGKIVVTFAECFVILAASRYLLGTRLFAGRNMAGARLLMLFFNVGFAYKLLLGHFLAWQFPDVKVSDYFAFGYLLSTLLALKMHDKEIPARLTRATLQTSLVAVLVATVVGFSLTRLPGLEPATAALRPEAVPGRSDDDLIERVRADKILLYQTAGAEQAVYPRPEQFERFGRALQELNRPDILADAAGIDAAARLLDEVGYHLDILGGRYLYLSELPPARGWGVFVLDPQAPSELLVEAPTAGTERGSSEASAWLFRSLGARGLALAGGGRATQADTPLGALQHPASLFHAFHRALARRDVLQLRRYTPDILRRLDQAGAEPPSSLWVRNSLPPGLDLVRLKALVDRIDVQFAAPPYENRQREETRRGFAELLLDGEGLRKLVARSLLGERPLQREAGEQRIDGYLSEWLLAGKIRMAAPGSEGYRAPRLEELLFWDEEILTPLLELTRDEYRDGHWSERGQQELGNLAVLARVFGYELLAYRHVVSGADFLILAELSQPVPARYWGTYVLRLGRAQNVLVEVPRPVREPGSFEFAVAMFERLQGRALLISGAHPDANQDGSADVLSSFQRLNLYALFNQVLMRQSAGPVLALQTRGYSYREEGQAPAAEAVVALDASLDSPPGGLAERLLQVLKEDGIDYQRADGAAPVAGYEIGFQPQGRYLAAADAAQFAVVRLSPLSRYAYRQQDENRAQTLHFAALDIPTEQLDLRQYLLRQTPGVAAPQPLRRRMLEYQLAPDIVGLRALQQEFPNYRLARAIDRDSQLAFLLVHDAQGRLLGAFNLKPRQPYEALTLRPQDTPATLDRFLFRGVGALLAPGPGVNGS